MCWTHHSAKRRTCFPVWNTENSSAADTPIARVQMAKKESSLTTSSWAFCKRCVHRSFAHTCNSTRRNSRATQWRAARPSVSWKPRWALAHIKMTAWTWRSWQRSKTKEKGKQKTTTANQGQRQRDREAWHHREVRGVHFELKCKKWGHRWTDCWKEGGGAHGKGNVKKEMQKQRQTGQEQRIGQECQTNGDRRELEWSSTTEPATASSTDSSIRILGSLQSRKLYHTNVKRNSGRRSSWPWTPAVQCRLALKMSARWSDSRHQQVGSSISPQTVVQAYKTKVEKGWRWSLRWGRKWTWTCA